MWVRYLSKDMDIGMQDYESDLLSDAGIINFCLVD
jgi:hypothetical protein